MYSLRERGNLLRKQSNSFEASIALYHTPFGPIEIHFQNQSLIRVALTPSLGTKENFIALPQNITQTLDHYFATGTLSLPKHYELTGTLFQQSVWRALRNIPLGAPLTYGELAKKINSHPRAVGQALKRNPLPIFFPCHRIVAQHTVGGFAGETTGRLIDIKQWLLNFERKRISC